MTDRSVRVRIVSYNVEFSRSAAPEQIGEALKPLTADLVGFCEAPAGDWTARVGRVLGLPHAWVGQVSSANHKDKFKSILSRTPFDTTTEHLLTSGRGWNPASVVAVTTRIGGLPVAFGSLHICASGRDDGHAHEWATKVLPRESCPRLVVVGDFNNELEDPAMLGLEAAGMRSCWRDLPIDVSREYTWNAFAPGARGQGVIDHVLYRQSTGIQVVAGGILEMARPLSDHKPIWAELTWPA